MEITKQRLQQLERSERKLNALECGGVDNWEGYGLSLNVLRLEDDINSLVEEMTESICEVMCEHGEEPAGRGAGYGIRSEGVDLIEDLLNDTIKKYEEIKKDNE